jgi:regulator of sirC expression with transglutaminase-like and TPR domain
LKITAPSPLEYFESLVAEDAHFALMEAAITVAQDEHPQLDTLTVMAQLDVMAHALRARLARDAGPLHKLRVLNHFFYVDLGFAGNVNNYYDVGNSYIHRVLETRLGIPITLALIFLELAHAVGLDAKGVSFPGHFLVKVRLPQGEAVIDPINGQSLSRETLEARLAHFRPRMARLAGQAGQAVPGLNPSPEEAAMEAFEIPLGLYLQAAEPRDVLARVLRNLKEIHLTAEDWPRLLAVQERLVRVLPQAWEERRDRGLTRGELSQLGGAIEDLETYLKHCADAHDAPSLRLRLEELKARRPSRLH